MILGAMTTTGLSNLHIFPENQNVTAAYYQENILSPFLLEEVHMDVQDACILKRKFHADTSELIFQQDGAPAHTAPATPEWLNSNFPRHWGKNDWPTYSPDLSPIENVWEILKEKVNNVKPPPTTLDQLKEVANKA